MAFNPAPSNWLGSWSEDGTNITVPIATFPELTAAEADAATGDIRKVVYAICEKLNAAYQARAAGDRPGKWTVQKGSNYNSQTGTLRVTYQIVFDLAVSSLEVTAES